MASSSQPQTFSMRIVCLDYYMAPPIPGVDTCYNPFQGQAVEEVPVIRVYGSTLGGQKTCLHVHQAFPYLYVPYDDDLPQSLQEGYAYVRCLASAIEKAMKLCSDIGAKRQHIHSCILVRAKKFYGYHPSEQLFIKIILYHPQEVARVAALLLGGGILNRVFQPYESHIPYLLQFLIDHNLSGMGHLHLSKLMFRQPVPDHVLKISSLSEYLTSRLGVSSEERNDSVALDFEGIHSGPKVQYGEEVEGTLKSPELSGKHESGNPVLGGEVVKNDTTINSSKLWLSSTVPSDWIWPLAMSDHMEGSPIQVKWPPIRQSTCELEADTSVQEILNQQQLMYISLTQARPEVKMVQSLMPIWEEEYSRLGMDTLMGNVDAQKPPAERVLKTLFHEHELRIALSKLIAEDEQKLNSSKPSPATPSEANPVLKQYTQMPNSQNSSGSMDMHEHLINFTQAANAKEPGPSTELHIPSSIGLMHSEDVRGTLAAKEQGFCDSKELVDEDIVRSQMTQSTYPKDIEKEDIELLRWIASSQAVGELSAENGGEELILSQLLHSACVERVLEKALTEFEDASQKECQDILDSIDDAEEYVQCKGGKNVASAGRQDLSIFCDHAASPEDVIPQLDGTWDDLRENAKSACKEKKARKELLPNSNSSDHILRGTVISSSSGDDSGRNRALWGSLPLASGGVRNELADADVSVSHDFVLKEIKSSTVPSSNNDFKQNVDISVTTIEGGKFVVNLETGSEIKERSLRDLMRKKRSRRSETSESGCHIAPKNKTLKGGQNQHDVTCLDKMNTQISQKSCHNVGSMHENLHGVESDECHPCMDPGTGVPSFDLKECSEKSGTRMVDGKFCRYGILPLVKVKTNKDSVESTREQQNKCIKGNICKEEIHFLPELGKMAIRDEDLQNNVQQQVNADYCFLPVEAMKGVYEDRSDKCCEDIGVQLEEHQELAGSSCMKRSGSLPLHSEELISSKKTSGNEPANEEREGKIEIINPELQLGTIYVSDSENDIAGCQSALGIQFTDISNGSQCSSEWDSHSSIWKSNYEWREKQMSPEACEERKCSCNEICTDIKEATSDRTDQSYSNTLQENQESCIPNEISSVALNKYSVLPKDNSKIENPFCENSDKEPRCQSGCEKLVQDSAKILQVPEEGLSLSSTMADLNFHTRGCKDSLQDELIALSFHRQPPTTDQIQRSLGDISVALVEGGGVYYGNVEDVPDRPAVVAGSIFEVKSREVKYLRPFFMESMNQGERLNERKYYIDRGIGGPSNELNAMGIPTHYKNDGSILYLLTPMQPPPSSSAVVEWLSQLKGTNFSNGSQHNNADITSNCEVDNNKSLAMVNANKTPSHMSEGPSSAFDSLKCASPKYNETHVFMIGPNDDPQLAETNCELQQPASAGLNGSENLVTLDEDGITRLFLNTKQSPDWEFETPIHCGRHDISRKLQFEDKNIPVNSPSAKFPDVELQHKLTLQSEPPKNWREVSQISAPSPGGAKLTPLSQSGFRDPASSGAGQQVTLMSIEVHAESRGDLRPDPRYDAINFIVVVIREDSQHATQAIVLMRDEKSGVYNRNIDGVQCCQVFSVKNEKTLLYLFVQLVHIQDPDILMGWEIQGFSLGFLAERAAYLGIGLLKKISRTPSVGTKLENAQPEDIKNDETKVSFNAEFQAEALGLNDAIIEDEWGRTHGSGIYVGGRIVLNLWRIMRGELNLRIYTLEAVAEAVLRRRVPKIPWRTLAWWFSSGPGRARFRCIKYFIHRAQLNLAIVDQLDMINRTSELARIFGIDFFSVFSRGSQYRVESMMLRLAHTQNFLVISPSRQQVSLQPAMECLPLVMEPESRFYTDPVVVLDFQSLYPSMIIAYNLCFSTCLGKIVPGKMKTLGVTSIPQNTQLLSELEDQLFITPNGVMYVPPEVRPGVLPRLLQEILSTRIMVKHAMKKLLPTEKILKRVLNARQLALKLIANVTYGYTAAGFSGRMPCAEIADSIVQCGRRTLENAINLVNSNNVWDARVVYGDTDSMFVLLNGRTREEAFRIGQEIASAVTSRNPHPVTLKMEKVYHPCVLLTKKRYVGYSYESPAQSKPTFDAKGIETVRRDGCPAVAKILEQSLRILFESRDLSEIKKYLQRQWRKILSGKVSLQDFIFAKEVRLGTYSMRASSLPAAAIVATKAMRIDPRAEPCYGERIPYMVVHGEPGARLADMVVDPLELQDINTTYRLHDTYYITKQIIPALQRVFGLVGVDIKLWYAEMPRAVRPALGKRHPDLLPPKNKYGTDGCDAKKYQKGHANKWTIDHYYLSQHCAVCGELIRASNYVCDCCSMNQTLVATSMMGRTSRLEKEIQHLNAVCRHCGGGDWMVERGRKEVPCIEIAGGIWQGRSRKHGYGDGDNISGRIFGATEHNRGALTPNYHLHSAFIRLLQPSLIPKLEIMNLCAVVKDILYVSSRASIWRDLVGEIHFPQRKGVLFCARCQTQ